MEIKKGKNMDKEIYKFINNDTKYVPLLAIELVDAFKNKSNDENVEYNFTIDGETKKTKGNEANTFFFFDTMEETVLDNFKKALFNEDLKDIEEESEEEKILMTDVRDFLLKICNKMTNDYLSDLKETVRKVVLGNKYTEEQVPLNNIEVVSIDISDYSSILESYKYILRIGKEPGAEINTDEVIKFVQDRQEKTGMDLDNIFLIEKKAGNPIFEKVLSIEQTRKFLNEISIYFFVDYSVNAVEEIAD